MNNMSTTLRSTKYIYRWFARAKLCRDLPLLYVGTKRINASTWTSPSYITTKRTGSICNNEIHKRYYGSEGNLPTHKKVPLPALSPTMERGTIVSWEKKEGDRLNEGDLLAEIETDKATMGFETPEEGYLAKILVSGGTKDVPIGKVVCIIVENEEEIAAFKDYAPSGDGEILKPGVMAPPPASAKAAPAQEKPTSTQTVAAPKPVSSIPQPSVPTASSGERVFASPFARKIANEKGINLKTIGKGSGPGGRITADALLNFKGVPAGASTVSASVAFTNIPLTAARQENYQQLLEWKKKVPQYYLTVDIKMDNVIKLKDEFNSALSKESDKLNETDFIMKASALACQAIPEVNSAWHDTHIRRYNTVNINVILNTDEGVYAPVIAGVERKGLASINKELSQLKTKALEGALQSHEFQGGTFTINNLAMYKVKHFSQIINFPQACSLSIGGIKAQFVPSDGPSESNRLISNIMCATLSCDHRVVDGAVGAQWLDVFKKLLEKPNLMLL